MKGLKSLIINLTVVAAVGNASCSLSLVLS